LLPFFAAFLTFFAPSAPSPSGCSGTTKRYLHFGQSVFLPIIEVLRIGTLASQLGQSTLYRMFAMSYPGRRHRRSRTT